MKHKKYVEMIIFMIYRGKKNNRLFKLVLIKIYSGDLIFIIIKYSYKKFTKKKIIFCFCVVIFSFIKFSEFVTCYFMVTLWLLIVTVN